MINLYNQVPLVYTSTSRDFQYVSWLVNIVLNSVKHNIDSLYRLPNVSADPKITELLATTLGFKIKRNYDQKQLLALVSILPIVFKYKGSITAIQLAADALVTASCSAGDASCTVDNTVLTVVLPRDINDTTLFADLLEYILPAGITCRMVSKTQERVKAPNIDIRYFDDIRYKVYTDIDLASLFNEANPKNFSTAKFLSVVDKDDEGKPVYSLNSGLFSNTIIPVLGSSVIEEEVVKNTITLYSTEIDENGVITHKQLLAKGTMSDDGNTITSVDLYAVDDSQEL